MLGQWLTCGYYGRGSGPSDLPTEQSEEKMARAKPRWRRVLNGRFLRWWGLRLAVRVVPWLGRRLAFFPDHVGLTQTADVVLQDTKNALKPAEFEGELDFLQLCQANDSKAPAVQYPNGIVIGSRTALFRNAWVDMTTSSILLPQHRRTVLMRGAFANWNATSARWVRDRCAVPGRVFVPLNSRNYFHVLLENIFRTLDLADSGLIDDTALTIAIASGRPNVELAFYKGLVAEYPWISVQEVPGDSILTADEVVGHFPANNNWEWASTNTALSERVARVFDAAYGDLTRPSGDLLFLSRSDAKLRNPTNNEALTAALEQRGFETFVATDGNHPEQLARFRAAKVVVSVHGAGLTNVVFCQPGTRVIEIFPENFMKSTYWWLARQHGLRYRPVVGGPGDYNQMFDVDIEAVLTALDEE